MSLKLVIKGSELFDEATERFIEVKPTTLTLEHSLIAVSKWEAKYHVPFLKEDAKTAEQLEYYFQCMTLNQNVDPSVYKGITAEQQKEIVDYIHDTHTATWIGSRNKGLFSKKKDNPDTITSELIYYWMIAYNIPSEYEKWHLNRLLTLIQVCNEFNKPQKKMGKQEVYKNFDAINEARKAKLKTRG